MELEVCRVYAKAIYEAAEGIEKEKEIGEELMAISDILNKERLFKKILINPAVPEKKKKEMIDNVFGRRVEDYTCNFLHILAEKGRMEHLDGIARMYGRLYDQHNKIIRGEIVTVMPLSEEKIKEAERKTSKLLKSNVKLVNRVDKKLIGGFRIFADGRLLDASYKTGIEGLKESLQRI